MPIGEYTVIIGMSRSRSLEVSVSRKSANLFVVGGIFIAGLIVAVLLLNTQDNSGTTAPGSVNMVRETIEVYRSPT